MDEIQALTGAATAKKGKKPTTGSLPLHFEVSDCVTSTVSKRFLECSAMKTGVPYNT